MKLSATVPIALVLAAGVAGVAVAQTATSTNPQPGWNSGQPSQSNYTQPQANTGMQQSGQTQQNTGQWQPNSSQMQSNAGQWQPNGGGYNDVLQAQEQLKAAGLYNGPTDGLMDPDTRAAVANFQEQHGLRRTERLDPQTMAALMSNQTQGYGSSAPSSMSTSPNGNQGQTGAAPMGAGGSSSPTGQPTSH
jgi:peptidoglycan hydrolase-like protein with peptidoglycan-binding domain